MKRRVSSCTFHAYRSSFYPDTPLPLAKFVVSLDDDPPRFDTPCKGIGGLSPESTTEWASSLRGGKPTTQLAVQMPSAPTISIAILQILTNSVVAYAVRTHIVRRTIVRYGTVRLVRI